MLVIAKFYETSIAISINQYLRDMVCRNFPYLFEFSVINRDIKEPIFYKPFFSNFAYSWSKYKNISQTILEKLITENRTMIQ